MHGSVTKNRPETLSGHFAALLVPVVGGGVAAVSFVRSWSRQEPHAALRTMAVLRKNWRLDCLVCMDSV